MQLTNTVPQFAALLIASSSLVLFNRLVEVFEKLTKLHYIQWGFKGDHLIKW